MIKINLSSINPVESGSKQEMNLFAAYDNTSSNTSPDGRQLSFDTSPSAGHNDYTNYSVADANPSDPDGSFHGDSDGTYTRYTDETSGGSD